MGQLCCHNERNGNHAPDEQLPKRSKSSNGGKPQGKLFRLFMTGMGGAGKTTIVRQLQLLCNKNASYKMCDVHWDEIITGRTTATMNGVRAVEEETPTSAWPNIIRRNILDALTIFVRAVEEGGDHYDSNQNEKFAEIMKELRDGGEQGLENLALTEEFQQQLVTLFNDSAIQRAYRRRNKLEIAGRKLFDGCDYFLNEPKIREVFSSRFSPSAADKVHSRNPTTDLHTYRFKINDTRIEICDVGGQRSELIKIVDYLRHWSFNAEDTESNFILLVVSMSDYNVRHERYDGTLLDECVAYMRVLMNNRVAQSCGLLIFFNKRDRFKEKLKAIQRESSGVNASEVKDYVDKCKFDERQMREALARKFVDAIKQMPGRERSTYRRFTCAVDTKMMEGIFSAIRDDFICHSAVDMLV